MTNDEAYEIMFRSFYDELGSIEKEAMEKEAILGALKGIGGVIGMAGGIKPLASSLARGAGRYGKQMWTAGTQALKNPQLAGQAMKSVYQGAGGGLKGIGAVAKTPMGAAIGIGGAGVAAAPLVGAYGAGRAVGGRRQPQPVR